VEFYELYASAVNQRQENTTASNVRRQQISEVSQPLTYAVIRVYDDARNVIETHEHKGDFKEW